MLKDFFASVPVIHSNSIVFAVQGKKIVDCLFSALNTDEAIKICKTKLQGRFDNVHVHNANGERLWSAR